MESLNMTCEKENFGQTKLSELLPHLKQIAFQYSLNLSRIDEFKLARLILVNQFLHTIAI